MYVRPSVWKNWVPNGRIFMKFGILMFFENFTGKFKFYSILGTRRVYLCTFMVIPR